jgi:hypothetical protein
VHVDVSRADRDPAGFLHRGGGVLDEVHEHLLDMRRICSYDEYRRIEIELDLDAVSHEPRKHAGEIHDELVEVECARTDHLPSAECEQLCSQRGRTDCRVVDLPGVVVLGALGRRPRQQKLCANRGSP